MALLIRGDVSGPMDSRTSRRRRPGYPEYVLALLGAIILVLFVGGLPAFRTFGAGFLVSTDWDPVQKVFGAAVPVGLLVYWISNNVWTIGQQRFVLRRVLREDNRPAVDAARPAD